jgi:hypothetical protein
MADPDSTDDEIDLLEFMDGAVVSVEALTFHADLRDPHGIFAARAHRFEFASVPDGDRGRVRVGAEFRFQRTADGDTLEF